jgi:cystathionine beta-lyase/cystathionine gamma-synthase
VKKKTDTTAITGGRADGASLSPALWGSTVWESRDLNDANTRAQGLRSEGFYSRYSNPTVTQFENAIAELEGAESALAFSSGMGAVASTVLALCGHGSHIVAQNNMYGATLAFLQGPCARFGIETTYVDPTIKGSFAEAVVTGRTTLVLAETPSNPLLTVTDLDEIGQIVGPFTVVDSTMATPVGQQPLSHGVDLVLHSATKGIGGHNDALLGVIAGEKDLVDAVWSYAVMHGATPSPHDALNALRGIRTMPIRVERQHTTLLRVADALISHKRVTAVHHPFLSSHPQHRLAVEQMRYGGTVFSFEIDGDFATCEKFVNALQLAHIATSFGGPETLICHPATSTHVGLSRQDRERNGITDGLLRVSIGLENPDDLVEDFSAALNSLS